MAEIILDLAAYQEETADIRMADGTVLHLRKPSERLVLELLRLKDVDPNGDPKQIVDTLNRVSTAILNNNANGISFRTEEVEKLFYDQKMAIVSAYNDFATTLQARPTASSPSSPATKPETARRRSLRQRFTQWRNTRGSA